MLALPYEFQFQWHYWMELPMRPHRPPEFDQFADVAFEVQSHVFYCHKAVFWTRSDYFKALMNDHFHEGSWDQHLNIPIVRLHIVDPEVFAVIVTHVYSNNQQLTPDIVYDVLEAAEMFLLLDLKRQCGAFLASYLDVSNAADLLKTGRLYSLPRLERACIEFMAKNIEEV